MIPIKINKPPMATKMTNAIGVAQSKHSASTNRPRAVGELVAIYNRNVFPDLKVTWGTYPNNLGHTDFPGCFRCHDGSHSSIRPA
jgi:hypothetical protein